jgi:EmrB/QacA subfamily drug resistance transporter
VTARASSPDDVAPGYLLSRRATVLAFSGLMLSLFLVALNQTIVATALPTIVEDLGGLSLYPWVFSSYILSSTITVPLFGRLSDIHGRRPFFIAGLVLLLAGSGLGALAGSMGVLIAARAVQGLGGGALLALSLTAIGDLVPPSDRGRWQAANGAVFSAASVLGPLTGGWIADHADWRWVFLVSIPVGVVALALGAATLRIPPHPERARSVDALGGVLVMGALSGVMVAVVEWGDGAAPADPAVALPLLAGLGLASAFALRARGEDDPFLPLELLRDRAVRLACLAGLLTGATHFGAITYVPLFAQSALGASATSAGLVLMPLMLTMFVAAMISGPAITRIGRYKWAVVAAPPTIGAGFAGLAMLGAGSPIIAAAVATAVLGTGLGLVSQNLVLVAQNSAPSRHLGATTGIVMFCRNAGGALGISLMGAALAAALGGAVAAPSLRGPTAAGELSPERLADAFHPVFWLGAGLMVVAFVVALRIPERPLRRAVRDDLERPAAEPSGSYSLVSKL